MGGGLGCGGGVGRCWGAAFSDGVINKDERLRFHGSVAGEEIEDFHDAEGPSGEGEFFGGDVLDELEDIETSALGGVAGVCDIRQSLRSWVKGDDTSVGGQPSQLRGEHGRWHHPAWDEDKGFVT